RALRLRSRRPSAAYCVRPGTATSCIAEKRAMSQGSMVIREGVRVVQGTPAAPLEGPALFLKFRRVVVAGKPTRMKATLSSARPNHNGYVIKDLIEDMELGPKEAL